MATMRASLLALVLAVAVAAVAAENGPVRLQNSRYSEALGSKTPHPRYSGSGGIVRTLDLPDLDKTMVNVWRVTLYPSGLMLPTFVPGGRVAIHIISGSARAMVTDVVGVPMPMRDLGPYDSILIGADQVYSLLNIGEGNLEVIIYVILRDRLFYPIRFATLTGGKNSILAAYSDVVQRSDFNVSKALYNEVIGGATEDDYVTLAKPELLTRNLYQERPGFPLTPFPNIFNHDGGLPAAQIIRLQPEINSSQYIAFTLEPTAIELAVGKGGPGAVLILNYVNNAMRYVYISEGRTRVEFATPDGFPKFRKTLKKGDIVFIPPAHPVVFVGPCDEKYELIAFITRFPPTTFSLSGVWNPAAQVKNIYNSFDPALLGSAFPGASQEGVDTFFNAQGRSLYLPNQNCPELFKGVFF